MGPYALRVARKHEAIHVDVIDLRFICIGHADFQISVHVMLVVHQNGYLINVVFHAVQGVGRVVDGQLLTAVNIRLLCGGKYQLAGLDSLGIHHHIRSLLVGVPVGTHILICIEIQLRAGKLIAAAQGAGLLNQTHIPGGIGLLEVCVNPVAHIVETVILMQVVGLCGELSGSREGVIGSVLADVQLELAHGAVDSIIGIAVARALVDGQGGNRLLASQINVHRKRTSRLGVLIRIGVQIAVDQSCGMRRVEDLSAVIGNRHLPGASVQHLGRFLDFPCFLKGSVIEANLGACELFGASDGCACLYYTDILRLRLLIKIDVYQIAHIVEVAFLVQVVICLGKFACGHLLIGFAIRACIDLIAAHGAVGSVIGIRIARPLVDGHGADGLRLAQIDIQSKRMSADGVLVRIGGEIIVK